MSLRYATARRGSVLRARQAVGALIMALFAVTLFVGTLVVAVPSTLELALSVSIGVGYSGRDGLDRRQLYAAADASLYRAKHDGRGRVGSRDFGAERFDVPAPRTPVARDAPSANDSAL